MENGFRIAEICGIRFDINGREIEFNLHMSACPRFASDFQAEVPENRLKLCSR